MISIHKYFAEESNADSNIYKKYRLWGGMFSTVGVIIGTAYVVLQLFINGHVSDKVYSGVLIANMYAVHQFEMFFISYFLSNYSSVAEDIPKGENAANAKYMVNVFRGYGNLVTGFVQGSVAVFLFYGPWADTELFFYTYTLFVFSANAVAGSATHSLAKYFYRVSKLGKHTEIKLWDRSCSVYQFIVDSDKYVLYAVGYIAITAIIASLFSLVGTEAAGYTWSIWSAIVLVLTFSLPLIPVSNKIKELKEKRIIVLNSSLQTYYDNLEENVKNGGEDISVGDIESIKKMREDVKSIRVFPPVGAKSLETAAIISILTLLPSLLEFLFLAV